MASSPLLRAILLSTVLCWTVQPPHFDTLATADAFEVESVELLEWEVLNAMAAPTVQAGFALLVRGIGDPTAASPLLAPDSFVRALRNLRGPPTA